jgi:outer membrane protein OmpA-like peptidoglycan-associated protein
VRKWLIEKGISQERLEAKGYGQMRPIDTNKTVAGRARNRRVEFRIVEGQGIVDSPN